MGQCFNEPCRRLCLFLSLAREDGRKCQATDEGSEARAKEGMKERKKDGNSRFLVTALDGSAFEALKVAQNCLLRCMMESPKALNQPDTFEADIKSQEEVEGSEH